MFTCNEVKKKEKCFLFLSKSDQIREIQKKTRRNSWYIGKNLFIVALTKNIENILDEQDLPYISIENYREKVNFNNISSRALDWVKNWPNLKIVDEKCFKELVTYRNVSLWWFVRWSLFYEIKQIILYVDIVKKFFDSEKPDCIIIPADKTILVEIIKIVAKTKNMNVDIFKNNLARNLFQKFKKKLKYYSSSVLQISLKCFIMVLRYFQGLQRYHYYRMNILSPKKIKVLMLTHSIKWQTTTDPESKKSKRGDPITGSIMDEIENRDNLSLLAIDKMSYIFDGWRAFCEKPSPYVPWEVFLSYGYLERNIRKIVINYKRNFRDLWKTLQGHSLFKESFYYNGVSLWGLLSPKFEQYLKRDFTKRIRNIEIARFILKKERIDVFCGPDEHSSGLPFIIASKLESIPTVGIQHGLITSSHPSYAYAKDEITDVSKRSPFNCPIPDKTVVFGQYYKDCLTLDSAYPLNSVAVTGQQRTDVLTNKNQIYYREKMLKRLGIESGKKIILFISQPHQDKQLRKKVGEAVLEAVKLLPDIFLIVKLHPYETKEKLIYRFAKKLGIYLGPAESDWLSGSSELYEEIAGILKVRNYLVVKDIDLYSLLNACDIVILISSTVALESSLFNKPVISLNFGEVDITSQVNRTVGMRVSDLKELVKVIRNVLEDSKTKRKTERISKSILSDFFYKIDGLASKRIVNLLIKLTYSSK